MPEEQGRFFAECVATDERVVVRVEGECDLATLDRLNDTLDAALQWQPQEMLVDLAETTFVDSLTLGALAVTAMRVRADGGVFRVTRAPAAVRRAFEMSGLDKHLLEQSPASRDT